MTKFSITTVKTESGWAFGVKGRWAIAAEAGSIFCPLSGAYEDEKSAKTAAAQVIAKEKKGFLLCGSAAKGNLKNSENNFMIISFISLRDITSHYYFITA